MNVVVDDRTLHELYLLPFEMSVKDAGLAALTLRQPLPRSRTSRS